jgi:hypothetical protein
MWQPSGFFPHNEATTWTHFFQNKIPCTLPLTAAKGQGHWDFLVISAECQVSFMSWKSVEYP